VIEAADYVVSVDSAAFHCAGGLGKPLTGIFTYCDGKVYGKYYDFVLVQKHRDNGDWPCGPCFHWPSCPKSKEMLKPCLTELTPDILADGLERMFQKWPPSLPYKAESG
jgi:ADP-heptose:LPS heptosyltransferase